jgi:hypothetical protein
MVSAEPPPLAPPVADSADVAADVLPPAAVDEVFELLPTELQAATNVAAAASAVIRIARVFVINGPPR